MKIELSVADLHLLLLELEHSMRFINVDTARAKYLHAKIMQQIDAKEITISTISKED